MSASPFFFSFKHMLPVPVAAPSKAWVCGRSPSESVGFESHGDMDICLLWALCVVR